MLTGPFTRVGSIRVEVDTSGGQEQHIPDDIVRRTLGLRPGEGDGPHQMLVIRGAILIDGTGGPPRGPVDIAVRGNKNISDHTARLNMLLLGPHGPATRAMHLARFSLGPTPHHQNPTSAGAG